MAAARGGAYMPIFNHRSRTLEPLKRISINFLTLSFHRTSAAATVALCILNRIFSKTLRWFRKVLAWSFHRSSAAATFALCILNRTFSNTLRWFRKVLACEYQRSKPRATVACVIR